MKKNKFLVALCLLFITLNGNLFAQDNSSNFVITESITIQAPFFEKSREDLSKFMKDNNAYIVSVDVHKTYLSADFYITENTKLLFDTLLSSLGYVSERNISTTSYKASIDKINIEKKYLAKRRKAYEGELEKMVNMNPKYYTYWDEIRYIEKRVYELDQELKGFESNNTYRITLNINDDTVDFSTNEVSWVNMPGVATDFLYIENPQAGISSQMYLGYSLKYMITKGKSHFTLGALKAIQTTAADTASFSEQFHFGFGQDFYTKHFGRGKRKWFNLYSGYNVGGIYLTGNHISDDWLPYANVYLGNEIFKNRYILFDTKVGYHLPFRYNRNMRGWTAQVAFNFVF